MSTARQSAAAPARVLYVLKRFPRLSETFVLREILELEAAGVRISVDSLLPPEHGVAHRELSQLRASVRCVPRRPRLRDRELLSTHLRLAATGPLRWIRVALQSRRRGGWRRFLQAGLVAERARAEGITHLHAHFATAAAEVVTMAAQLAGVSCSVTAHAKDIHHRDNRDMVRTRLAGCRSVVTVSHANVAHLQAVLDPTSGAADVRLIRNGVPTQAAAQPGRAKTVLCVARLVPKKGIDVLLYAAALLAPRQSRLRIDIIGTGPLADDLLALRNELGLAGVVQFLGSATSCEVRDAMRDARVVVLPCRIDDSGDRDGMPTVLVEAMAHGVPVISCDVAGVSELVRDGTTGLLVPSDDAHALADAIAKLVGDPRLATRLGHAGRELVDAGYRPDEATTRLLQVFGLHRDIGHDQVGRVPTVVGR
jgi:glycosyltransferase involved in cell wall biosynthesis